MHGEGKPLIMLHGNGEDSTIFSEVVERLSLNNELILVDSRGHGRSSDAPLHYEAMALDIIMLIKHLGLNKPIIYGFSDGGIIALIIAIKCPNLLKRAIISGANINPRGLSEWLLIKGKISYLFKKNNLTGLMLKEPNIKPSDLNKIKIPINLIVGEHDCIKKSHTMLIHNSIKDSTLEIVPGENHSSYIIKNPKLYDVLKKYLNL